MNTQTLWINGWKEDYEQMARLYMADAIRLNSEQAALMADGFFAAADDIRAYERQMRDAAAEMIADGIELEPCEDCGFLVCQCGAHHDLHDFGWCGECDTELGRGDCSDCREERRQQRADEAYDARFDD